MCWSHPKQPGYNIKVDFEGKSMLTNKKETDFEISELEVYEVT